MGVRAVAVSMVKNEADVIVPVVERLLAQRVDRVVVCDNGSTDGTRDLLADLARRAPVNVLDDRDPAFLQAEKMSALADSAWRTHHPRWIVPFDADEWWTLPPRLPRFGADVRGTPIFNHVCTGLDDAAEPDPIRRMRWRRPASRYHKVIVRWRPQYRLEMGNHHALRKAARLAMGALEGIELHHFGVRSLGHMIRKFVDGRRAVEAAGDAVGSGLATHWREVGALIEHGGEAAARERFLRDYHVADPRGVLVEDPCRP